MVFAVKAEVRDLRAQTFTFPAQKTMYGGKHVAEGDTVFVFASETDGGHGYCARRRHVRQSDRQESGRRSPGPAREHLRQTDRPREAALGTDRSWKRFTDWDDGRPETELNFKFYRQATNKVIAAYRMRRQRFWMDSSKLNSMRQAERESRRAIRHRVELSAPKTHA